MSREIFPNAPVTEALLDLKVMLPPEINLDNLNKFHEKIIADYPYKKERKPWQSGFEINEKGISQVEEPTGRVDGYLFKSQNEKIIVQARLDGFTFNILKPYTKWEDHVDEAKRLWNLYIDATKPTQIQQIGLRYINRIELPLPVKDLKEYLLTVPEVSPEIEYPLSGFFMQLLVSDPNSISTALVTETVDTNNDSPGFIPIIFDIDVTNKNLNMNTSSDFWGTIDEMREFKNYIFIKSLTEKGKELFR